MPTGKVKWFDDRQGFGFIIADDGGPDVFVHRSVVEGRGDRPPSEGESVAYEVEITPKGPRALAVTRDA